jgi:hypothetical protein
MSLTWRYAHATTPAGPGSDTVISDAVQVDAGHKLSAAAAVGDVAIGQVTVDDPGAVYNFKGLWRWYAVETECPVGDQLVWNGYIGPKTVNRRGGNGALFPVGAGRGWHMELREMSKLATLRVIWDTDGNRPAETIAERLAWLIGTVYLPVNDNGLIVYDTTELDANDYRQSSAADVLNDMAIVAAFNWWIYYDGAAADGEEVSLAFFDPHSSLYSSSIKISNVAADVDGVTVFAPFEDADVEQDPDKIAAGVYMPASPTPVYEFDYDTSYAFAFQDQVAPPPSVKTVDKAVALADRFLADFAEEEEKATIPIQLPAAQLNDIKHGQRMQVKLQHVPGWESYRWCRVTRKTFGPPENRSQKFYDVDLELLPITSPRTGAFGYFHPGDTHYARPELPTPTTPGNVLFMITTQQATHAGVEVPTTHEFRLGPVPGPGTLDTSWTELALVTTNYYDSPTAYGIYTRFVNPGEVTTTPVDVRPRPQDNFFFGVFLWELPANVTFPAVATYAGGDKGEGAAISVGASLSGTLIVGGFNVQINDYGHRLTVTPTSGDTLESADAFNDDAAPVSSPTGVHPPWTWIGTRKASGPLVASFNAPYDSYPSQKIAGAAVVIHGLRELTHINGKHETPPDVTP